jgi:hypothetical protein
VSLREQFVPDLKRIHLNADEHATWREFRISDGHGGFKLFRAKVGWFDEDAKLQPVVARHGVYLGDVVCYITHDDLPRKPVAGEIIYSPANQPWEVIDCTDEEGCWMLNLSATRSQPGHYGQN